MWPQSARAHEWSGEHEVTLCLDVYADGEVPDMLHRAEAMAYQHGYDEGVKAGKAAALAAINKQLSEGSQ